MRIGALVLSLLLAPQVSGAAAYAGMFAPEGCEFRMALPTDLTPDVSEWGGRRTVSVASDHGTYAIRAACTTGYPPGALAALGSDRRLAFVERLVAALDLADARVSLGPEGNWVDVAGMLPASTMHLRTRIVYGRSSRLMVEILSSDESKANSGLNSVFSLVEFLR